MIQQKVSLFQNLRAVSSKAIDLEEVVRLIQYDLDVTEKTEAYRQMKRILGKPKADEEVKEQRMPAVSVAVLFDGIGRKAPHVLGVTGLALCDVDGLATAVDEAFERAKGDPHASTTHRREDHPDECSQHLPVHQWGNGGQGTQHEEGEPCHESAWIQEHTHQGWKLLRSVPHTYQ